MAVSWGKGSVRIRQHRAGRESAYDVTPGASFGASKVALSLGGSGACLGCSADASPSSNLATGHMLQSLHALCSQCGYVNRYY
ncbi:hypothetical protein IG631_12507 [Alternaria alternata]|nr:hypothetical protein IG631_12507 [Alternaria alternata]